MPQVSAPTVIVTSYLNTDWYTKQLKDLTAKLRGHVDAGEDLKIETKVDPKLVGGFTVAMGEDFFDLSLMSRIRAMEQELAKPV